MPITGIHSKKNKWVGGAGCTIPKVKIKDERENLAKKELIGCFRKAGQSEEILRMRGFLIN